MKKIVAISTIVAVTMILTMGYLVPQIAATHESGHNSPLYLEACSGWPDVICTAVVDVNRNGVCDADEPRIIVPQRVADRLPQCPDPDSV